MDTPAGLLYCIKTADANKKILVRQLHAHNSNLGSSCMTCPIIRVTRGQVPPPLPSQVNSGVGPGHMEC